MLCWNVYVENISKNRIEKYNVFDHCDFLEDCRSNYNKNLTNKEAFLNQLRKDLLFWYWCKCEWEVFIVSLFPRDDNACLKVDVYSQIKLNWKPFCDYVWANKDEFRKESPK